MKILFFLAIPVFLSACSSSLHVFDSQSNETKGVLIYMPVLMEITSVTNYKLAKESEEKYGYLCTPETTTKIDFLPLGERYYINFDPAKFGDAEFSVQFNDSGTLKEVSLNSKASSGVEQVSSLLSTVLPFVKAPKATPEAAAKEADKSTDKAADMKGKYCLIDSTKVTKLTRAKIE